MPGWTYADVRELPEVVYEVLLEQLSKSHK